MKAEYDKSEYVQFLPQKNLIYLRGYLMLIIGSLISFGSIIAPDVVILAVDNAWLPVAAFLIILIGLVEIIDTYISRHTNRFFVNLQFAILDTVVGFVLFFSLGYEANRLSILIAVFLMVKGLFRFIGAYLGKFANAKSSVTGGAISIVLGFILWVHWPLDISVALLSFSLSIEIALRGWALIHFADWLDNMDLPDSTEND